MNSNNSTLYRLTAAILALSGIAVIVLAFFNDPLALQLALGFIGLGLLCLSLVPMALSRRKGSNEARFELLISKLDEIKEELKNREEHKGQSGIAIADLISSGMKWYSDYTKDNQEENPDTGKDEQ